MAYAMVYIMKWEMTRGFTLLELLCTIVVLGIVLTVAAPSFQTMSASNQMKRVAGELEHFLVQAKSEAVWRNQDLWAHIESSVTPSLPGQWRLILTDSDTSGGAPILYLDGASFRDVVILSNYTSDQIKFDGVRGKVKDGNLEFYIVNTTNQNLKLKSAYGASRVMICAVGGSHYGYAQC